MSLVYVIAAGDDGPCKIGFSDNPDRRCGELQASHWLTLEVRFVCLAGNGEVCERFSHHILESRRLKGEWFDVSVDDAIHAVLDAYDRSVNYRPRARLNSREEAKNLIRLHPLHRCAGRAA